MIWLVLFPLIVGFVLFLHWLLRIVNLQRSEYREPEGNVFFDALSANPNRGRYS